MVSFQKESTVRFDALLEHTVQVASLILEATTNKRNSSFPSQAGPGAERLDWGEGGDEAIMAGVNEALNDAAVSVHDEMEEELMIATARGAWQRCEWRYSAVKTPPTPVFIGGMVHHLRIAHPEAAPL